MLSGLIYAFFGAVELLVGLRFFFLLIGANASSQLVTWVYHWSQPLVAPFSGIIGQHPAIPGVNIVTHGTFDWTTLLALIVYAAIGGIIGRLLGSLSA